MSNFNQTGFTNYEYTIADAKGRSMKMQSMAISIKPKMDTLF
jgi:hypothetical protein